MAPRNPQNPQSPASPSSPLPEKPRLSEEEKKANHIKSEQKRREAIRDGFDRLANIVPGLSGQGRSEAVVLEGTLALLRSEILKRETIINDAKKRGVDTTGWELPPRVTAAAKAQVARMEAEEKERVDTQVGDANEQ
ncbi:hypothetical protein B0J11DRAFT_23297 [Dendryphion nanum]|uniref:BHLH domain-containing protein n=1 Tax=Dendryphion nanum TaxID=256645 RepID=A0A9P9EJB4_9PLEO|nr:hypothetical protein B0J11DRAFT_23297 [Dendryphion nanum]